MARKAFFLTAIHHQSLFFLNIQHSHHGSTLSFTTNPREHARSLLMQREEGRQRLSSVVRRAHTYVVVGRSQGQNWQRHSAHDALECRQCTQARCVAPSADIGSIQHRFAINLV